MRRFADSARVSEPGSTGCQARARGRLGKSRMETTATNKNRSWPYPLQDRGGSDPATFKSGCRMGCSSPRWLKKSAPPKRGQRVVLISSQDLGCPVGIRQQPTAPVTTHARGYQTEFRAASAGDVMKKYQNPMPGSWPGRHRVGLRAHRRCNRPRRSGSSGATIQIVVCERALLALNGASSEQWFQEAGFKVFCAKCWDEAKRICGGFGRLGSS